MVGAFGKTVAETMAITLAYRLMKEVYTVGDTIERCTCLHRLTH